MSSPEVLNSITTGQNLNNRFINNLTLAKQMEIAQILGWIATFLFSIMIIPQIIKTIIHINTFIKSLLNSIFNERL